MPEQQPHILQTIIDEFRNLAPDISDAFIYGFDGAVVATLGQTDVELVKTLSSNYSSITAEAQEIDEIENLAVEGGNGKLSITPMKNLYLATVSTSAADLKIVKSLTRVIIPTVAALLNGEQEKAPQITIPIASEVQEVFEEENPLAEPTPLPSPQSLVEPFLPVPPISQFMIEKISGLMVAGDTVRIDSEAIAKWSELYKGREISQVNIQTLDGRATTCKFIPIKDAKTNSQGKIQIPEKILQTLQTSKGNLVIVKPAIN
jgi:predicted regulator of Ras-like GTPase activity (Roadblock/LC7/MglB family)